MDRVLSSSVMVERPFQPLCAGGLIGYQGADVFQYAERILGAFMGSIGQAN